MMQEALTLKVAGYEWGGWEEATLDNFFGKTLCSRMALTLADKWRSDFNARPIVTGQQYTLWLGTELRQTGWISKVNPGYGPTRHGIRISGRDLTCDLVDCSSTAQLGSVAAGGKGSKGGSIVAGWSNRKLEQIAADLCAEFNIPVVAGDDTGAPIAQAKLQIGETPFQILERLCRTRNVWCASTVDGALTFRKANPTRLDGVLIRGQDILEADGDFSDEGRFSVYIGKGQQRGSDTIGPEQAALVTAQVSDPSITRHRPLVVQGEDQQNGETLADRVKNEMNKRIGDSRSLKITVAGWRVMDGANGQVVWPVNRRVAVSDDWLGANGDYVIEQASFNIGKTRHDTTLALVPPEKFDITYTGFTLQPAITSVDDVNRPFGRTIGPI